MNQEGYSAHIPSDCEVNLLLCGLMIKIILLACDLERESFVPQTSVTCRCCCGGKEKVPSQASISEFSLPTPPPGCSM